MFAHYDAILCRESVYNQENTAHLAADSIMVVASRSSTWNVLLADEKFLTLAQIAPARHWLQQMAVSTTAG
jgi:hypothetical protein